MPLLPRLSSLWRNLFRKARAEQELTEEIDAYLEMLIELKIKEGLAPAEARRAALIELGGKQQVKEKVRDVRVGHQLETLWQDLRYALRVLRRQPVFTLIAIFTLALGIGANTAIFSVVNAVILRPLPYRDAGRLAMLWTDDPKHDVHEAGTSYPNFLDWRTQSQFFAEMAIFRNEPLALTGADETERVAGGLASASLFPLLGVKPLLGRAFSPDEEARNERVVVLSYGFWQRRFGGSPNAIGQTLELINGKGVRNAYHIKGCRHPNKPAARRLKR